MYKGKAVKVLSRKPQVFRENSSEWEGPVPEWESKVHDGGQPASLVPGAWCLEPCLTYFPFPGKIPPTTDGSVEPREMSSDFSIVT